jgi:hypothetical protein
VIRSSLLFLLAEREREREEREREIGKKNATKEKRNGGEIQCYTNLFS